MGFRNNQMAMNDISLKILFYQLNHLEDIDKLQLMTEYIESQHEKIQEFEKKVHHMGSTIDFLHGELYELATEEEYAKFMKVFNPEESESNE